MKSIGGLIDRLKSGEGLPGKHINPYLSESLQYSSCLYTQNELIAADKNLFIEHANGAPIILEIGCYQGKTITEMAVANPDKFFLGLDITYKRVVKSARKINKIGLKNVNIAICEGATFLKDFIPDHSLFGVFVFFPDPWPKDKTGKNRLINQHFLNLLKKKLQKNGFFWLKTDSEPYFSHSHQLLISSDFQTKDLSFLPQHLHGGPYVTPFQNMFMMQGEVYYEGVYGFPVAEE